MPKTINYDMLPEHMQEGARLYVEHGVEQGSFLTAVLSNDLVRACSRADETNLNCLVDWARWLYNEAPLESWGSPKAVKDWIKHRGFEGL